MPLPFPSLPFPSPPSSPPFPLSSSLSLPLLLLFPSPLPSFPFPSLPLSPSPHRLSRRPPHRRRLRAAAGSEPADIPPSPTPWPCCCRCCRRRRRHHHPSSSSSSSSSSSWSLSSFRPCRHRPPPRGEGGGRKRGAAGLQLPRGFAAGRRARLWREQHCPAVAPAAAAAAPAAAAGAAPAPAAPAAAMHRCGRAPRARGARAARAGLREAAGTALRRTPAAGWRCGSLSFFVLYFLFLFFLFFFFSPLRKHLQEIPSSGSNVSSGFAWDWESGRTAELLSGMGVSVLRKERLGSENTPQELLVAACSPHKKQKVKEKEKEKDFVIVRRPRLLREAEPGVSWDALPDELLLAIFAYLPLNDLLKVSMICKRWHCLSFDEFLWQTLDLTCRNLLPGVIGQLLPAGVTVFRCPRSSIGNPQFKTMKPLRVQHMDLSNCTVSVPDLQSILCRCERLENLSLEGLVLSDDILRSVAKNTNLIRLNLCGCSGFSAEALELMLSSCSMLEELNLSWCDFTATHVKAAVNHVTSKVTQLNLSGYRQNLQISDVKTLVERCPSLVHLDLSDSVMLKPECFQYFHQLVFLQHLCLSRCYQISPAALVELGEIPTLKTLQVFGIVTDSSLQLLRETLPDMKINCSHFTTIARPTVGTKKNHEIWGIKCRLTLRTPSSL
uniref:S-phase kinase-associated protein 2 n=1 Tax=Anas platyrhynchos TaxID=8839 RepID=A0A8B9SY68_ANAPL